MKDVQDAADGQTAMPDNAPSPGAYDGFTPLGERLRDFFSVKGVFDLRNVIIMGLMAALAAVLSRFSLYITPTFKAISFSYLPGSIVAMLFGPWAALVFGFVSDTVGYFSNPQGGYFFGYALSAMASYFIYACFLYKRPVKVWRVAAARALILLLVVFGLNFLWQYMMSGAAAGAYFTSARLINNVVQFPFHVALITFVGRLVDRVKPQIMKR